MKQQDKLRTTLQEYYDNQQESFSDNDWERASAYLQAARRKRRTKRALLLFIPLLSAFCIAIFNYTASSDHKEHQVSLLSEQKLNPAPDKPSVVFPTPVSPKSAFASTSTNRRNTVEMPATNIRKAFGSDATKTGATTRSPETFVNKGLSRNTTSMTTPVAAANTTIDKSLPNVSTNSKEAPGSFPAKVEAPIDPQNEIMKTFVSQAPPDSQQPANVTPLDDTEKKIATTDTIATIIPQAEGSAPANLSPSVSTTNTVAAEVAATDTLSAYNLTGEGIFYEAGAAWLYGWKGPVHRDARGFSPVVSINYMNRLNNRCALSFGFQYLQVSNLSNSSKTSRVSSYVYGEQSSVTVITPSSLYYLVAPLRLHYYKDKRNSFGIGINLAYLLNVEATVTSYDERPGFTGNYKTVKLGGYSQGFSWFDSQLAFSYRRIISGALGVQAELFIGLTDVKQDQFFGFKNKERNSGAKLSLVYYAFRKNRK